MRSFVYHGFLSLILLACARTPQGTSTLYTYLEKRAGGDPKKVFYTTRGDIGVVESDIILGTVAELEAVRIAVESEIGKSAIGIATRRSYWANGEVPYTIDSELPDTSRVTQAISQYHKSTPLRFIKRTDERDYITFRTGEGGCSSYVGKTGRQQFINIGEGCLLGQTIHEIGHAVGLWHEQSREDRDDFVTIHWDNISEEERHNFDQHINDGRDIGDYDFRSIMHYGPFAFSKNRKPTITLLDGSTDGMGQRSGLSDGDIAALNALY